MIEFFKECDKNAIVLLWSKTFGDSTQWIEKYLSYFAEFVLVYKENDELLGMLSLLPVNCNNFYGRYIYAVATDKKARSKGIATKLLEFSKDFIKEKNEDFLVLVPSEASLFDFYKKRGYTTLNCIEKSEFLITQKTDNLSGFEKISPQDYCNLRQKLLKGFRQISWGADSLEKISALYNGDFYYSKSSDSLAFCVNDKNTLYIKEFFNDATASDLESLASIYQSEKIILTKKGDKPFAMVYPENFKNSYFNIAID